MEHLHDEIGFEKIDPLFHLLQIGLQCGSIVFLKIRNPLVGGYGEAAIFQAFQDGDRMTLIDFTGAGAAFDGPGCAGTIQRHFSGLQGQSTVVFQKHHCLTGCPVSNRQIFFFPAGYLTVEAGFG